MTFLRLEPAVEGLQTDAEDARRLGFVAPGSGERALDRGALDLLQGAGAVEQRRRAFVLARRGDAADVVRKARSTSMSCL